MKVRVWMMTDKVGSKQEWTITVDDTDFADMSSAEQDGLIGDEAFESISQKLEWGWEPVQ